MQRAPRASSGLANTTCAAAAATLSWLGAAACSGVDDGGASDQGRTEHELRNSDPNTDDPITGCVGRSGGTLTASATSISLGQSVTLTWHATLPAGCANVSLHLGSSTPVATSGSMTVTPQANITYSLTAVSAGATVFLASVSLNVAFPPAVTIIANNQIPMLCTSTSTRPCSPRGGIPNATTGSSSRRW